jgi:hypothetical protein
MSEAVMPPTPGLVLLTILGSLAYLGLAVLGWGGFTGFFANPARIALVIAGFLLAGTALFSGSAPANARIVPTAGCSWPSG